MAYQIPSNIKSCFFDLNGTLIKDKAAHFAAFKQVFDAFGISFSEHEQEEKTGNKTNNQIWPVIFKDPLSIADVEALSTVKERTYIKLAPALVQAVPGALELITTLKQRNIYLGLVSNGPPEVVKYGLSFLGLEEFFDDIITSSLIHTGKPDPESYLLALKHANILSYEAVAFEDSPQGVAAAVAAGIPVVGVTTEYSAAKLYKFGATATINNFFQVTLDRRTENKYSAAQESLAYLNQIPIQENNEPLIDLRTVNHLFDIRDNIPPFVRESVYKKLNYVAENLPPDYHLLLRRGYRSIHDQKIHWNRYKKELLQLHPNWPKQTVSRFVNKAFSPYDQPTPPGHSTGGAVDVLLTDRSGIPIDLVPPLKDWSLGATFHANVSDQQQQSRILLCKVMESVGFSNYPCEYWHFSYGDSAWAARTGNRFAIYDCIEKTSLETS